MKYILILILSSLSSYYTSANNNIDSLKSEELILSIGDKNWTFKGKERIRKARRNRCCRYSEQYVHSSDLAFTLKANSIPVLKTTVDFDFESYDEIVHEKYVYEDSVVFKRCLDTIQLAKSPKIKLTGNIDYDLVIVSYKYTALLTNGEIHTGYINRSRQGKRFKKLHVKSYYKTLIIHEIYFRDKFKDYSGLIATNLVIDVQQSADKK